MRSLRGRLTLGVVLVLAAVVAAVGGAALREVDRSERRAIDDRLRRTAELLRATAIAAVQEELPESDRRLEAVLRATGSSLRLVLGDAVLLDAGRAPGLAAGESLRPGFSTVDVRGGQVRAYVTRLSDPALGGLARLEVTASLGGVERRQDRIRRRFAVLGVLALLVAAAGTWLAADLALRPLRRLRRETSAIAGAEDLSRRVPESDGPAELQALAADFNAMLARLGASAADRERALEATRRFASDAGHELRTPLTALRTTLSTLARHPDLPADRRAGMLAEAAAEQERLVGLLTGLQALARGDAAPPLDRVDVAEVVDAALAAAADRHPEVRWRPELPDGAVVVRGWEPGLRSLADNLLENAARHGRPGGGTVRVAVEEAAGGGVALVVEDDGPGIPADQRDAVLEPFARVPGTSAPGSGLGLALVAQQARHHRAELDLGTSPELGGARVAVVFAAH